MSEQRREYGHGSLYRRDGSAYWWAQLYIGGKKTRLSTHETDESKARAFLRRTIRDAHSGRFRAESRSLRYEAMRAELLRDYRNNSRKSRLHLGHLDAFFAGSRVSEIRTPRIRGFIEHLRNQGLAAGTVNRQLAHLSRMMRLALIDEKIAAVPHIPKLKEAPERKGFLGVADFHRLLAKLPDYLKVIAALGYHTGMRRSEIMALRWERVDLLRGIIRLDETKNGEARDVPVTRSLGALLRSRRRMDFPFVCWRTDRDGNVTRARDFRRAWEKACVAAGLGKFEAVLNEEGNPVVAKRCDRPRGKGKPQTRYVGLIFHDLRRSAVRNLVESGLKEKDVMLISGHNTRSVFDRYNIRTSKDVADAAARLEAYYEKIGHISGTVEGSDEPSKEPIQ